MAVCTPGVMMSCTWGDYWDGAVKPAIDENSRWQDLLIDFVANLGGGFLASAAAKASSREHFAEAVWAAISGGVGIGKTYATDSNGVTSAETAGLFGGVISGAILGTMAGVAVGAVFGVSLLAMTAGVIAGAFVATAVGWMANTLADMYDNWQDVECPEDEDNDLDPPHHPLDDPPISPLIIDLDGDGVETVALHDSGVWFDLDMDGFAQKTGWVAPDDALLALDRNANGRIDDISELFGSGTEDGFSVLAREDSNSDGVIDAEDAVFDMLRLWRDANSDGVAQEGELLTLSEMGLTSISLAATAYDDRQTDAGAVSHGATVTWADGTTTAVEDVWFDNTRTDTVAENTQDALTSLALALPTLAGQGRVDNLTRTMSTNDALATEMRELVISSVSLSGQELRAAFEAFFLKWVGADGVDPDARGGNIDARHLAALEALVDYDYLQTSGTNAGQADPGPNAGYVIEAQYQEYLDRYFLEFSAGLSRSMLALTNLSVAQGDMATAELLSNEVFTGRGAVFNALMFDATVNRVTLGTAETALSRLATYLPNDDQLGYVAHLMPRLTGLLHTSFADDKAAFRGWLETTLNALDNPALREVAVQLALGNSMIAGGTGDDLISANDIAPASMVRQPVPVGSILLGGAGADTLDGQAGGDLYVIRRGDGADVIEDSFFAGIGGYLAGTGQSTYGLGLEPNTLSPYLLQPDRIAFLDRRSDEATFTAQGDDLLISFADSPTDSVLVRNHFALQQAIVDGKTFLPAAYGQIEFFVFSDRSMTLIDISATNGDDLLLGSPLADTMAGGAGNDVLFGNHGADLYIWGIGDGADTIDDNGGTEAAFYHGSFTGDALLLSGSLLSEISLTRSGQDVVLTFGSGPIDSVTLADQAVANMSNATPLGSVEALKFMDGTLLRVDTVDLALNGDPLAGGAFAYVHRVDAAGGTLSGAGTETADVFVAGLAEATLNGGTGHDTYIVHAGDALTTIADKVVSLSDITAYASDEDTLILRGLTMAELTLQRLGDDLIVLKDGVQILQVTQQFLDNGTYGIQRRDGIETLIDGDLNVYSRAEIEARTLTIGTVGDDYASGIDYFLNDDTLYYNSDRYDLGQGNDFVWDQNGSETYYWRVGDGNDTIDDRFSTYEYDPGADSDRLILLGMNRADIALTRVEASGAELSSGPYSGLRITNIATGEYLTVFDQFTSDLGGLEVIGFADGSQLDRTAIADQAEIQGTLGNDYLSGGGAMRGMAGDDFVDGMNWDVEGGVSGGQALWRTGDGNDTLSGVHELVLEDVVSSQIRVLLDAEGNLLLRMVPGGETLTVLRNEPLPQPDDPDAALYPLVGPGVFGLEKIRFASGQIWSEADMLVRVTFASSDGDDSVIGSVWGDRLSGGGGNDLLDAGDGDDTLIGGTGSDILLAGAGNDLIVLSPGGTAEIVGGAGQDTVSAEGMTVAVQINLQTGDAAGSTIVDIEHATGGAGADLITGDDGANLLLGGAGADTLSGGAGDDTLSGGRGPDQLIGGDGTDLADYGTSLGGVTVSLTGNMGQGGDATSDTLAEIEDLAGSNYADHLTGNAANNRLEGRNGDDSIAGGLGNDTLSGGAGHDTLTAGDGNDDLDGGVGYDLLQGGAGDDTLRGGTGSDTLDGGAGSDHYEWTAGVGDDAILERASDAGTDTVAIAGALPGELNFLRLGDDLHIVRANGDRLTVTDQFSGGGIEVLVFDDGAEMDRDAISLLLRDLPNTTPTGMDDTLETVTTNVTVFSAQSLLSNDIDFEGNSLSIVGLGAATGGTIALDTLGNIVFTAQAGQTDGSFRYRLSDGTSETEAVARFAIQLPNRAPELGAALTDLHINSGQQTVFTLPTGSFVDPDADSLTFTARLADGSTLPIWLVFDGQGFTATPPTGFVGRLDIEVTASDSALTVADQFTLQVWPEDTGPWQIGTAGADSLTGTSGADWLAPDAGNDTISAGAGNDWINYASGNDVILGHVNNLGNDTLDLRQFSSGDVRFSVSASDVLITTADGTITLGSQTSYDIGHLRSNIETILFSDGSITEADIRVRAVADQATSGNDSVTGTGFADVLNGATGNDTLAGGAGDDTFLFTSGNDVISGNKANAGADTLNLAQYAAEDVHFNLSGTDVLIATADGTIRLEMQVRYDLGDTFSNIETIQFNNGTLNEAAIRTRAVADQMTSGHDSVIGTAFNDVLSGGAGNDTLNGGAGADTFMFTSGNDVVLGHVNNAGADTLNLSQYAAADVRFSLSGSDVVITTANGTIRLGSQLTYDLGNARSNIETIVFSNGTLNEAAIRTRSVADQATAGNDIIVGTAYADILNGGAGNDTMTGGAGADTFVFGVGAGKDRVTDFALASDHIRFSGHVFSDLTITQSGANTLVAFGVDDVMTLVNITASNVTAAQFDFV